MDRRFKGFSSCGRASLSKATLRMLEAVKPGDETKMMTAEECAKHIAVAIENRKRTLVLTSLGKRILFMSKLFPSLADKLIKSIFILRMVN